MGTVIALNNKRTVQHRLIELKQIALLATEADQLYGSIRFWMFPKTRKRICDRADTLLQEAIAKAERYYTTVGLPVPEYMFRNIHPLQGANAHGPGLQDASRAIW